MRCKKILRDIIVQSTDLFKIKPYFLCDEFSLVDVTIAPICGACRATRSSCRRRRSRSSSTRNLLFSRAGFRVSLSDAEREMRILSVSRAA